MWSSCRYFFFSSYFRTIFIIFIILCYFHRRILDVTIFTINNIVTKISSRNFTTTINFTRYYFISCKICTKITTTSIFNTISKLTSIVTNNITSSVFTTNNNTTSTITTSRIIILIKILLR